MESSPTSINRSFVSPKIKICEINGKGKGIIALENILRGTLLMCESPAISLRLTPSGTRIYEADILSIMTSDDKLSVLLSFPELPLPLDSQPPDPRLAPVFGRFPHFLPMGDSARGLFPTICRANHACIPNAMYSWQEDKSAEVLYAMADICEGNEVEVSYKQLYEFTLTDFHAGSKYSSKLETAYGFTCVCKLCSKSSVDRRRSERRMAENTVTIQLPTRFSQITVRKIIKDIERQCIIMAEEGHPFDITVKSYDAFRLCAGCEDEKSAREWLLLLRDIESVGYGEDSQEVKVTDGLLQNIRGFKEWGIHGKCEFTGPSESLQVHAQAVRLTAEQKLSRCNNALCKTVGKPTLKLCSRCKKAAYCSPECQKMNWSKGGHKRMCNA